MRCAGTSSVVTASTSVDLPEPMTPVDLSRAARTAEVYAELTGARVEFLPALQEINVGTWAGLTNEEVFALSPDFKTALRAGRDFRRSPTGETGAEAGALVAGDRAPDGPRLRGQPAALGPVELLLVGDAALR